MRYRCKTPVHHGTNMVNQRRYEPGEIIELSDEHAKPLLACNAIEPEHQPKSLVVSRRFANLVKGAESV